MATQDNRQASNTILNDSQNATKSAPTQENEVLANLYNGATRIGRAQVATDGIGLVIQVGNWALATASEIERQKVGAVIAKEAQQMLSKMPQDSTSTHGVRVKMTTDQFGDTTFHLVPGKSAREAYNQPFLEGPGSKTQNIWIPATDNPKSCPILKNGQPVNQMSLEEFGKMFGLKNLNVRADAAQPENASFTVASNDTSSLKNLGKADATEKVASPSLSQTFDYDKPKPSISEALFNDLNSPGSKINSTPIQNSALDFEKAKLNVGDALQKDLATPTPNSGDRQNANPQGDSAKKFFEDIRPTESAPKLSLSEALANDLASPSSKVGINPNLNYAFDYDRAKLNVGDALLKDLATPSLKFGDRQIDNPFGDSIKKILEGVHSDEFTPKKNLDNAAALMIAWEGDKPNQVVAGPGKNGHIYLADGVGETARMVAVNVKDTDGAAQKLFDTVIAKSQEPTPTPAQAAPAQETETRKQSAPSLS